MYHQAYQQIHLPDEVILVSIHFFFFETGFNVAQDSLTLGVHAASTGLIYLILQPQLVLRF